MPTTVPISFDVARLARIRSRLQGYMTDACTIARTGQTVPCLLLTDTREAHPAGQPDFARLRRWRLAVPSGTDVKTSDVCTVQTPGTPPVPKGIYVAVDVLHGETFSVRTLVYAMRQRRGDGTLDLYTNAVASFKRPATDAKIDNVPVYYGPLGHDVALRPYAADFRWMVMWDAAVVFSDGTPPGNGDQVLLPFLTRGRTTLSYVEPPGSMAQPIRIALIKDTQ